MSHHKYTHGQKHRSLTVSSARAVTERKKNHCCEKNRSETELFPRELTLLKDTLIRNLNKSIQY